MENKTTDEPRNSLWQKRLEQLQSSGKTQKDWCRENEISESTLRYWKRKLRPAVTEQSAWVQLSEETRGKNAAKDLTMSCNGIVLWITPDADAALRDRLLRAMIGL